MKQLITFFLFLMVTQIVPAQSTFHGNVMRTGVYASPGPEQFNGVKWKFKTNGPVLSSPAIADGVVFFGSEDGLLYAVDQQTGQQKWKFQTKGAVSSSPAVENGVVYFGSFDGRFYALDANSGSLKWQFQTGYERRFQAKAIHGNRPNEQTIPDAWDFFTSSPAVFKGRVYFGSGDGNVYALDAQTGTLKWKFQTGDVVHSSPALADDTVYVGSWDSYLYALDAATGQEKWKFKAGEDPVIHNQVGFTSSPDVVSGVVYIGCRDGHLYAVDATTGSKRWAFDTNKGWVSATPAVKDGMVYVGTGSSLQFLMLDASTGKAKFTFDMKNGVFSSAALAGNLAYVGNFNGRLYAFDISSGSLAWQFQTESSKNDPLKMLRPDGSWNPETLGVPVFNDFQDMYLLMYRRFSVGAILSSPVVDHGEIYFGSTDGFLYAIR